MVLSISPHPSVGPLWFRRLWWCLISASAPCVSYLNIRLWSKTTGGFYHLFICLFACELLTFYRLFIYLFDCLFGYVCYLFILFVCLFSLFYSLLGGSHFLLSLQPTTTGVILSLYFMVNVRREVGTVNGLIDWWSNMSWVGGWVWQQVISHHNDGKKKLF